MHAGLVADRASGVMLQRPSLASRLKAHGAKTLRIAGPILPHLDEEKQMNPALKHFAQLLPGLLADLLYRLATFTQHDLPLAFALDEYHLVDANRPVRPV